MKRVLIILGIIMVIAAAIALAIVLNRKHSAALCNTVLVSVENTVEKYITPEEIEAYTLTAGKSNVIGKEISEIDVRKIEKNILGNPYVARAEVFITPGGVLKIIVRSRVPLLRVFNRFGQSYYIDDQAFMVPSGKPARVLVANGNIGEVYMPARRLFIMENLQKDSIAISKPLINRLFLLALYISQDAFLRSFIQQIYVNEKEEFELIPLVGNFSIIFGGIDNIGEKFENIRIFYRQGLLNMGWDKYKSINVKFKNQIICNKTQ